MREFRSSALARTSRILTVMIAVAAGAPLQAAGPLADQQENPEHTRKETSSKNRLNILGQAQNPEQKVLRIRQLGDGNYICSPSGFGRSSRCYRN